MSIANDLRKKGEGLNEAILLIANDPAKSLEGAEASSFMQGALLQAVALYQCTAALIDSLPDERERAENAVLGSVSAGCAEGSIRACPVELSQRFADALLKQRQADAQEGGAE